MPNCFQLMRKDDPEKRAVRFVEIDEEMCRDFGVPCDPKHWYFSWYDIIGFAIACGQTFATLRERYSTGKLAQPELLKIVNWLDERFVTDAWYQVGK